MGPSRARRLLAELYRAALAGVETERAVAAGMASPEVRRAIRKARRVGIFAVGKAAAGMARGARSELGLVPSLVVLPRGHPAAGLPRGDLAFASHPEPDAASVRAADRALRFFRSFGRPDLILCLISGGASSLLARPRAGWTLAEKKRAVRELALSGASILSLNRLRASLSAVKGGRLGRATRARLVILVLSDVPGNHAAAVGSGPTVRGRRGDILRIVGSNRNGLDSATREARRRGFRVLPQRMNLSGEASVAGRRLARKAGRLPFGSLLLAGGETVVTLGEARGRGGRSLELALAAAMELDGAQGVVMLAAGSDGKDGSSSATGAFADGSTRARASRLRLDARAALRDHATHRFFAVLGDLFVTGPTGTNVGDWVFALRVPGHGSEAGGLGSPKRRSGGTKT